MAAGTGKRHSGEATRATRPRNRGALITSAASDLFYRRGYARVGMSDIADAVGIGPSALYRHFAGKQRLLMRVVWEQLQPFKEIPIDVGTDDPDSVVHRLATTALDNRQLGVLWQRESRHLTVDERAELAEQLRVVATRLAELAQSYRPELSDEDARFRGWCVFSALTSPSYHHVELAQGQFEELLRNMVLAIVGQPAQAFETGGVGGAGVLALERRASRRRLLLLAATRLFAEKGYAAVTTEDIGAAAGIAGPSVYNHFASKQELLNAVITRGNSWLELELERTLSIANDVQDALSGLLRSYIVFALEYRGFIDILIAEIDHLPDWERHRARQTQHEYVSEWTALLCETRAELEPLTARVLVQAALTVANDMARTGTVRNSDGIRGMGEALMLRTAVPEGLL